MEGEDHVKSIPPWKSNDMKVSNLIVINFKLSDAFFFYWVYIHYGLGFIYNDLFFLFFFLSGQSFIWMQQAMHPELNYSSYFRKKWVRVITKLSITFILYELNEL